MGKKTDTENKEVIPAEVVPTDAAALSKAIKAMEKKQREEALAANPPVVSAEKIFFDQWWAANSKKIPAMHRKEIVFADFKGRGLTNKEFSKDFDLALKKYGLDIA